MLKKKKSTHYVRAIAVFKISLTLCVIHLSCFWMDREGGSQEEGGEDWLVVIYKHCVLWLPFPRLKHKKRLVTRCVFFFFSRQHLVWGFSYKFTHSKPASQHSPFSLSHTETHTQNQCMHTHTPRRSLATELPLQWDHCFKNKAVGFKSRNIL